MAGYPSFFLLLGKPNRNSPLVPDQVSNESSLFDLEVLTRQSPISCNDDDGGCTSSDGDDGGGHTARSLTEPSLRGTKEQELQAQASS
jgi:hypothetical protein